MNFLLMFLSTSIVLGGAATNPTEVDSITDGRGDGVRVLPATRGGCGSAGTVCFRAASPSTVALPGSMMAAIGEPGAPSVAHFARRHAAALAARTDDTPWTLRLDAWLRRPAHAGNMLFVVYDADDARAIARHEVTALHQARVAGGKTVCAELRLSPTDGVAAGRHYRVRLVQLLHGKEVILADGEVALD